MKAKELENLIFSPFHTSKILHYFFSGVQLINKEGIKTELVYLVLPIIYNNDICLRLSSLNSNSKFSAFLKNNENFQIFVCQINTHIKDFKKVTNQALVVLNSQTELDISDSITITSTVSFRSEEDKDLYGIYKAAYNLGLMMGKERYTTIFFNLRITAI